MKIDSVVAEIGSTTTTVSAFDNLGTDDAKFLGQGQAPTTVLEGDVRVGLRAAVKDLETRLGIEKLDYFEMLATSSAAGGLKMTVHGLVHDMTARAANEAALGAGAIVHNVTAGKMRRGEIAQLEATKPNIILLAGGVDHGERDTVLDNAEKIAALDMPIPVIYAGNVQNHDEIRLIFSGTRFQLRVVENVYPKIDLLNVDPARKAIQEAFEEHIVHAPGMEHVRELVEGPIVPTPGAVMTAAELLYESLGDLVVFDVGGATSDLHSVTTGDDEISRISISPEPQAKRTVEGDLGVYVNMKNVLEMIGHDKFSRSLGIDVSELKVLIDNHQPIPKSPDQTKFTEELARYCVLRAVQRHAGTIRGIYSLSGKRDIAEGKDLTAVRYVIGTGGALTQLPNRIEIMKEISKSDPSGSRLIPREDADVLVDRKNILAPLGVLSQRHPKAALKLARESLGM
ncbi:GlmL-related ornithine degradation protein [uncultured Roseovarius sp.]|uniref:GlmL-related ornithine degradation protein n=1 Tax=uncultured Roseovarius sp. TaxID=293344 RepID=UPI0026137A27|nr:GlmL-related ornithine degradation protein [uncultured Roseovarius sp.]